MPDAYELYRKGAGPFVFTCEHASARIPRPLRSSPDDLPWLATHWAVDIGAANVTRELARRTRCTAVLARFSRLVCDANRPADSPDWALPVVEGCELGFNRGLGRRERTRRRRSLYEPYHAAIDRLLERRRDRPTLVAIHSFTPELGRERRAMEVGVLFNQDPRRCKRLARLLSRQGWETALNAPYSGEDPGMIYSIERHGRRHGFPFLELEIRQDLIGTAPQARRVGRRLAEALREV